MDAARDHGRVGGGLMQFKSPHMADQLLASSMGLQDVVRRFREMSEDIGVDPVVTRVWDPVPGDSGVHEAHRAVDFRDHTLVPDERLLGRFSETAAYTAGQVRHIVETMNAEFPREDGKLVCIHHSFCGGMLHFHLQVPVDWGQERGT